VSGAVTGGGESPDLARELLALGTATVYEASKLDCALTPTVQAAWPGARVVGRALPVSTDAGDNLPLHVALELARRGDVLVVDAAAGAFGHWGEVMTVAAMTRGVAGLVINGCIRDVEPIRELGFPVFATGRSIIGTRKSCKGVVDDTISFAGSRIAPGDLVIGDADGVVVVPRAQVEAVVQSARARAAAEEAYMQRLRDGELTLDIYDLRGGTG
jgi:4-hydroxy-4-methyl-2-oxoglutarate aldolase